MTATSFVAGRLGDRLYVRSARPACPLDLTLTRYLLLLVFVRLQRLQKDAHRRQRHCFRCVPPLVLLHQAMADLSGSGSLHRLRARSIDATL